MGFGTRTPTSNDPEDLPRSRFDLGGEEGVKQRQAQQEFTERVQKKAKEKRQSEFDKAWIEYANACRGGVLVGWVATMIKDAAQFFYTAGRKAENAAWEERDPGFEEKDFH